MIQIVLLTGFLGAGKTTLMQSLLETYSNNKIGVIINEFGKVNIDAKLVKRDGIDMAELSNGSIFCACIKDKFVDGLIAMSKSDIEYLFIEASGLADPSNMGDIINGIKADTKDNLLLKGSICIVDGQNFLGLVEVLPALERQVQYGNAIIVNKLDLIDDSTFKEISDKVAEINQSVKIYGTSFCNVDIKEIVDHFAVNLISSQDTTNTYESRPNTFILKADGKIEKDKLIEFLEAIAKDSYRIKGFADTDQGILEISAVVNNIILTPWEEKEETEIVVISAVGIKMLSEITEASTKILGGRLYL
ncbi:MAG: CobW family GTP-binding protein [Anaerovoracaceae bacterium]